MSELLKQILNNPDQFPDDATITVHGQELGKAGDLRKMMKDQYLPKADMTALTEKAARERETLQAKLQQTEGTAQQLSTQLQQALARRNQAADPTGDPLDNPTILNDEYLGPLARAAKANREELARQRAEFEQAKLVFNAKTHLDAIRQVTTGDKDYESDDARMQIVNRMRELGTQRADVAYRDLTRERDFKAAAEKAKAEGIEEGRKLAKVPPVLAGGRRSSAPPKDGPKTMDEAAAAALADPEVLEIAAGLGGEF